jgi:hypothetical protein
MKKLIALTLVLAAAAGVQAQVISWNDSGDVPTTIPTAGIAGIVPAANWNNSTAGMSLLDNTGAATGASFTVSGSWGAWHTAGSSPGQDANTTYNRNLLNGYANTSSGIGPEVLSISSIPYPVYNLIVYLSSDTAGRTGTLADSATLTTYDFTTIGPGAISGANAVLTQSTDTGGLNPSANYVIFSNVGSSSDTLTLNIPVGGGISGFQIVAVPEPGVLALAACGGFALLALSRRVVRK